MPVKTSPVGASAGEMRCMDMLHDSTAEDDLGGLPGVGGVAVKGRRVNLEEL